MSRLTVTDGVKLGCGFLLAPFVGIALLVGTGALLEGCQLPRFDTSQRGVLFLLFLITLAAVLYKVKRTSAAEADRNAERRADAEDGARR